MNKVDADFGIIIDFDKNTSPTRALRAFSSLVESFEKLDKDLIASIDSKIKPVILLEDLEAGSIKGWLKNRLESVPDDALKDLDWKPIVGAYLVKAKYLVIDFLEDKTEISDKKELQTLESNLLELAEETEVKRIPAYKPIDTRRLILDIKNISESVKVLDDGDKATFEYVAEKKSAKFNLQMDVSSDSLVDLVTEEEIKSNHEMILKVKKPDYLGDSQWEFRHEKIPIRAKIVNQEWLKEFQERKVNVRPGDSIRAQVETIVKYDFNMEVVGTDYIIHEVIQVIPAKPNSQQSLLDDPSGDSASTKGP